MLKISDTKELFDKFPTLTDAQETAYLAGAPDAVQCTPDNLYIDFQRRWKGFKLNQVARHIIVRTFQRKAEGGTFLRNPPPPHLLTDESVSDVTDNYMKSLRRAWRKGQKPPTEERLKEIQRQAARNSRTNTVSRHRGAIARVAYTAYLSQLYQSRLFVCIHFKYTRHQALLSMMAASNMSGDETDGEQVEHPPVYRIIIAAWQSHELRTLLWSLDAKYIDHWKSPPYQRRTSGNPVRVRRLHQTCRTVSGIAPIGLWRNCYNSEWLETLDEWEIELLEINEEEYDFALEAKPLKLQPPQFGGVAGPFTQ